MSPRQGVLLGLALQEECRLDCSFPSAFYKHLVDEELGLQDLMGVDPALYRSLMLLAETPVVELGTVGRVGTSKGWVKGVSGGLAG